MKRFILVQNLHRKLDLPIRARWCRSFACRLRGLMFRRHLAPHEGLLLVQETASRLDAAIHMLFVFTDLAVFWLSAEKKVVDKVLARAWQPVYVPRQPARYILEAHPQRLDDFQIGEQVEFSDA
ncbi:MAG: DUF192 domain-containing protein [Anaerolineales bacterium]